MRTTSRRFAFTLLVTLAPATFPELALAQPATSRPAFVQGILAQAAPDPTIAAAHARFAEGVAFFDKGEFENARASFLQAYALHKHPAVLINLAQSSLRSGHTLDAARDFSRYMHDSANLTPAQRAEAEKGLAEARQKLGRIDVSAPAGTAVTVDGDLAGTDGSTTWDVEPGAHTVKGAGDTTTVSLVAGQTVAVKLGKGIPMPVPIATPSPPEPITVPPPPPPPDAVPAPTPLPTPSGPGILSPPASMLPVWLGVGAAVVGFGGAIIFGVFKANAVSSYNSENSELLEYASGTPQGSRGACNSPTSPQLTAGCQALVTDSNAVSSDATVANVGIAIGVIGVAFAAGWYLFAPKADRPSGSASNALPIRVEPILAPHTQGLNVGMTF
jgi:hypothetical protein